MTLARVIPDAARERQRAAANPERSVFVSANAGSGKTHVLVQRVINLLLRREDPGKILCITFTKAAAAEIDHGQVRTRFGCRRDHRECTLGRDRAIDQRRNGIRKERRHSR